MSLAISIAIGMAAGALLIILIYVILIGMILGYAHIRAKASPIENMGSWFFVGIGLALVVGLVWFNGGDGRHPVPFCDEQATARCIER